MYKVTRFVSWSLSWSMASCLREGGAWEKQEANENQRSELTRVGSIIPMPYLDSHQSPPLPLAGSGIVKRTFFEHPLLSSSFLPFPH